MNKLSTLIVASALAVLPALGAARADTAENLRIFRDVCLANAPALNDAAIRRAAESVTMSASGGMIGIGTADWRPGQQCRSGSNASGNKAPPSVAEFEALVVETFNRLGGSKYTMKRIKKNSMRYKIVTPAGRFEISADFDGQVQNYYISKR